MIYARIHDQSVIEHYFKAIKHVEQRLSLDAGLETGIQ